jgi:hypothetical protein
MFRGLRSWRLAEASAAALAAFVALISIAVPALDTAGQSLRVPPPEEQPEQYPSGANRDDTFYFCTACHSFKIVAAQGMSRERWDESLDWMVKRHNMPDVQGEDREKILDYLASAFPERRELGGWKNPFTPK